MFNLNTGNAMKIFGQSICQNCVCNHTAVREHPETCTVIGSWGFPKAESNILFSHQTQLVGKDFLLWEMYPSEHRNSSEIPVFAGNYCKYYTESQTTNLNGQSFWTDMDPSSGVPLFLLQCRDSPGKCRKLLLSLVSPTGSISEKMGRKIGDTRRSSIYSYVGCWPASVRPWPCCS